MTENKQQIQTQLWNIANDLRGNMGADEFRDYILGLIFYKYLSDSLEYYFDTEWLKGEGTPRRFGEQWREINGIEGRHQCRRFVLHELRLRRSASRGSGENGDDGGGHESVEWSAIPRNLANEPA